jgi:hypothetical protein
MGPKHGVARGVAVFTGPGTSDPHVIVGALGDSGRLQAWSLDHGVTLSDDPACLEALDDHLDEWQADPSHHESVDLANEVGIFLGNLMLLNVVGSEWIVWPNGHPVIRVSPGTVLDVTARVGDRLQRSGPSLASIYRATVSK